MKHLAIRRHMLLMGSYYWAIFVFGLIIMALGITLMITAQLGSAPWDVFHIGLFKQLGLTIGTWSIIVGFVIVATTALMTREWPQIGAFANMVLVGIFIDMYLAMPWMVTPELFIEKFIMLLIGILLNGLGIGLYIAANRGAGPRDSLMLVLTKKFGWKLAHTRRAMEVTVLICGWLLGGPVWIGTIMFSLSIGSIVGMTIPLCQRVVKNLVERGASVEDINKGTIRINHHDGTSKKPW